MGLKVIAAEKAPAVIGPCSQGISAGFRHVVSGRIGLDPASGELVSEELVGQAHQALKNLQHRFNL